MIEPVSSDQSIGGESPEPTPGEGLNALVVEDAEDMRRLLEKVLLMRGHHVMACSDAEAGWEAYRRDAYHLVFLDWQLPGIDGIELCRRIREVPGGDRSIIVMITARDQPEDLQTVLAAGANDYMAKPVDIGLLKVRMAIAEQWARNLDQQRKAEQALRESEETLQDLRRQLDEKGPFQDLLGKSTSMRVVYEQIREFAKVDTTVLIEGETGTGKELVARAIHFASARKSNPFIAVNCAGLTDSLLASQLFGHRKGAFTGAIDHQQGFFEAAHGGTLFLDEIGDVSPSVQTSLLRVLQEREITRLGESKPRKVDVRVLTATHHNLSHDVSKGSFRADLLYRIRVARIHLPSLRDRREDVPLLVASFLGECCAATGKPVQDISREAMQTLKTYTWPGNVRELRSAIECAVIVCKGNVIQVEDLPPEIINPTVCQMVITDAPHDERSRMIAALDSTRGNRTVAARLLGMSRATLYRRLAELDLPLRK